MPNLLKSILLLTVVQLTGCSVQQVGLWENANPQVKPPHIENVYALNIFDDQLNGEVWASTTTKSCLALENSKTVSYDQEGALSVSWNKQAAGCDWLGVGFGWDGWSSKDLSQIMDIAAIELKVFNPEGRISSLPMAAALEDYSGLQSWIGLSPKFIHYHADEKWATVRLPLKDFGWQQFDADPSNIKQFVLQFEAQGALFFDEIRLVVL